MDRRKELTEMNYTWYLVIDHKGNVLEAFNSYEGAEQWQEEHGGRVVKVQEVQIRYE